MDNRDFPEVDPPSEQEDDWSDLEWQTPDEELDDVLVPVEGEK